MTKTQAYKTYEKEYFHRWGSFIKTYAIFVVPTLLLACLVCFGIPADKQPSDVVKVCIFTIFIAAALVFTTIVCWNDFVTAKERFCHKKKVVIKNMAISSGVGTFYTDCGDVLYSDPKTYFSLKTETPYIMKTDGRNIGKYKLANEEVTPVVAVEEKKE